MQSKASRRGIERVRINLLRLMFVALLPAVLFTRSAWLEPEWMFEIMESTGIALVICGVLGRFWAILYIGGRKNSMIMQDGPYSICRHPLYLFSTVATLGFGMMLGSLILTAVFGGLVLATLAATARSEEEWLRRTHGAAYDDYARRVPMILPNLRLFRSDDAVTFSVTHLRRNLMDALVFLFLIPLAEFLEWLKEKNVVLGVPLW